MTIIPAALVVFSLVAAAQDAPKADAPAAPSALPAPSLAPAADAPKAAEAPKADAAAKAAEAPQTVEAPKAEAKVADAPKPAETPKPAEPPAPKPENKPATAADEWRFLKSAGGDGDLADGLPDALKTFVRQHPDDAAAPDAKYLEAQLREKGGDYKTALTDYLRVIWEAPSSPLALQAKSAFLALADRRLSRKYRAGLDQLVSVPDESDKATRLSKMLENIANGLADAIYEPALQEFSGFRVRYPDFAAMDGVIWNLGWLHERNGKHAAALLEFKELAAICPGSARRPQALAAIGKIYSDGLRDYQKSVAAYQDLVEQYPDDPSALEALQATSALFSEKLKQYELAVQIDEKIVQKYPKTPAALKALRDEADLLRNRLSRPGDAIAALKRVPDNAAAPDAIGALEDAAQIARKDMKDYKVEIALRSQVASDFATSKDAADQLYQAGQVAESDLNDAIQATNIYQQVQTRFAGTKPARKAAERIAKLEKK